MFRIILVSRCQVFDEALPLLMSAVSLFARYITYKRALYGMTQSHFANVNKRRDNSGVSNFRSRNSFLTHHTVLDIPCRSCTNSSRFAALQWSDLNRVSAAWFGSDRLGLDAIGSVRLSSGLVSSRLGSARLVSACLEFKRLLWPQTTHFPTP